MASTGNLASIPRGKCRRKGSLLLAGHPNVKAISRRGTDRGTVLPAPLVQLGVVGGVGVGTSGAGQLDSDWSRIMRYAPRRSSRESRTVPSPGPWRVASRATGAQGARARTSRCRPGLCGAARRGRTGYSDSRVELVRPGGVGPVQRVKNCHYAKKRHIHAIQWSRSEKFEEKSQPARSSRAKTIQGSTPARFGEERCMLCRRHERGCELCERRVDTRARGMASEGRCRGSEHLTWAAHPCYR